VAHIFEKGVNMQLIQRVSAIFLVVGFITTCLTKQVRTESQSYSRI